MYLSYMYLYLLDIIIWSLHWYLNEAKTNETPTTYKNEINSLGLPVSMGNLMELSKNKENIQTFLWVLWGTLKKDISF